MTTFQLEQFRETKHAALFINVHVQADTCQPLVNSMTRSATMGRKPGFQQPNFDGTAINRSKCTEVFEKKLKILL
jgi:hypothetical protein